nr:hypothetical protein CFP56_21218 [Quercus suber]
MPHYRTPSTPINRFVSTSTRLFVAYLDSIRSFGSMPWLSKRCIPLYLTYVAGMLANWSLNAVVSLGTLEKHTQVNDTLGLVNVTEYV